MKEPWEEFLKKSSIKKETNRRWRVYYEGQIFIVEYETFLFIPRNLEGNTAFRVKKFSSPEKEQENNEDWEIHVRADLRFYPDEEILRVVWSHLDRTEGDFCTLYNYDRLDNSPPEGAIGDPVDMGGGIKRWRVSVPLLPVQIIPQPLVDKYVYVGPDGEVLGDIILVNTSKGYRWEISTDYSQYDSFKKAERTLLKHLSGYNKKSG